MLEQQQEGDRTPVAETKQVKKAVLTLVEVTSPDIKDLDSILEGSERVITAASISEGEIDEMIEKRKELLEKLQNVDVIRGQRLRRVENYNPLIDLTSADYERLASEKIVDAAGAERLKKLDEVIAKLDSLEYSTADSVAELERLTQLRSLFQKKLDSQIEKRQQEIAERREAVKSKLLDHYARKIEAMEGAIAEIEANPRVIGKFNAIAEQERRELEEEIEKLLLSTSQFTQALSTRHAKAFERLGEITGNEGIVQDLLKALKEEYGRKRQNTIDGVRSCLIKSVIEAEGEQQLKKPKEVVPWEVHSSTIPYTEAMNSLRYRGNREALKAAADDGNEQAERRLKECEQILNENRALSELFGRQRIKDRKTGKKCLGAFWALFETRRENDKNGTTEARKRERKEAAKREAKARKTVADILKRGGFAVNMPIVKLIGGKQRVVGKKEGAIRLEKTKSKKGNEHWMVAEISGGENVLDVGSTSPLNMSSFPSWLRGSAKDLFIMHGEDFDELLVYESEEQESP